MFSFITIGKNTFSLVLSLAIDLKTSQTHFLKLLQLFKRRRTVRSIWTQLLSKLLAPLIRTAIKMIISSFCPKSILTIDPKYTLGENVVKITTCRPTE